MMNQQRLKAYLDVIQGLLSCPQGEEWILLRQNQELVDRELVEVMEQVAHHLAIEGNSKAATYLHNWAGKLHHILMENLPPQKNQDKTEAYIELIQALLSCADGSEAEILAAHQDLIGPELVKVMKQVANKIALEGDRDTASFLNNLATDLNRTWLQHHEFQPTYKQEIAPDPWLDEDSSPSARENTLDERETLVDEPIQPNPLATQAQAEKEPQLLQQLQAIADSLVRLETMLTSQLQPVNPLWYMDVLEKASSSNWILTTEEIEKLIGIKPHCHHDETAFYRGSWVFTKAGKVGAQMGWQVERKQSVR